MRSVTQVVGHGDETQASDVGIVPRLVQLLLGCVITWEALCRFCNSAEKTKCVSRFLPSDRFSISSGQTHQLVVA